MNYSTNIITEEFYRYEFKYLLNPEQNKQIEAEISNFMQYDGHVHKKLGCSYYVRSLYFDNITNERYYEKIDGIRFRKKFRIRTYGKTYEQETPIFLEEKGRYIDRTYKHRVKVLAEYLPIICIPGKEQELSGLFPNVDLIQRFIFEVNASQVRAKILVDYIRRPYTSNYDVNFRVTFDSHLVATNTDSLFPDISTNWKKVKSGYTIMEVKFFRRIPAWFHRIIQAHQITRLSISKFCKGMEVTEQAIDLS